MHTLSALECFNVPTFQHSVCSDSYLAHRFLFVCLFSGFSMCLNGRVHISLFHCTYYLEEFVFYP